jgi:uncharacterized phage-associated protein
LASADTIITATKRRYKRHSAKKVERIDHAEQPILVAGKKKEQGKSDRKIYEY